MNNLDNLFALSAKLQDTQKREKQAEKDRLENRKNALKVAIDDVNEFGNIIKKLKLSKNVYVKSGVFINHEQYEEPYEIVFEFFTNGKVALSKGFPDPFPRGIEERMSNYDLNKYGMIFDNWKLVFEKVKDRFCKIVEQCLSEAIKNSENKIAIANTHVEIYRETKTYKGENILEFKVEKMNNGKWESV